MAAMLSGYAIVFLGVIVVLLWHTAYGRCRACNNERTPRCGCDEDGKRKPWKNHGR